MHDGYPDIGEVLGEGYRLEAVLGTGRASRVYRAEQVAMSRPVAVKVLSPLLVRDALLARRFEQEIKLGVHLHHPNLVSLYDAGCWVPSGGFGHDELFEAKGEVSGLPFLVMELLEGHTLRQYIAKHPEGLPVDRCGEIARQVLAGLAEMHAAGIVHRDISPTNIFICDLPGTGSIAKLLNFGVAKVLADNNPLGLNSIDTVELGGGLVGSPRYMAPEIVRQEEVTPAADLYSFGLLMAEMVTGEPVVQERTRVAMVAQLKLGKYPALPPSLMGSPLAPVLQRCIAPLPEERYATCEDLLCDLVLVGMGTSETVRFSSDEALMRYEARRKSFEQKPTSRMDSVDGQPATIKVDSEVIEERAGLAKAHGGLGRASQDMRASVPGMTQRVDSERALREARDKLGEQLQTRSDTSVNLRAVKLDGEDDEDDGRLFYGVAVLALTLTVALLGVALVWLWWQSAAA